MSGIYIKGAKMPKHCGQCRLKDSDGECMAMYFIDGSCYDATVVWGEADRPEWCPLIETPDHGDLIDRSKLKDEFIGDAFSGKGGFAVWSGDILSAPVVIPAERSEE